MTSDGAADTNHLHILSAIPKVAGWQPVSHMIELASKLLKAPIIYMPDTASNLRVLSGYFKGRRKSPRNPDALVIVPNVQHLRWFMSNDEYRAAYNTIAVWVIDSFNTLFIPKYQLQRFYDLLFITNEYDQEEYIHKTGVDTKVLTWGSDVLGLGGCSNNKEIDLLRIGRQPDEWENDEITLSISMELGLNYHGRPPSEGNTESQFKNLIKNYYRKSKLVLAHTN